jgi:hypothetical protein
MTAEDVEGPAVDPLAISEEEIDAVLYEARGDAREAIRMLLRDMTVMAMDADAATSRGFVMGRFSAGARRPRLVEEP